MSGEKGKFLGSRFTVRGAGVFPADMLRYDCCWPVSTASAMNVIGDGHEGLGPRAVELITMAKNMPTKDRWVSFGWVVTQTEDLWS